MNETMLVGFVVVCFVFSNDKLQALVVGIFFLASCPDSEAVVPDKNLP